MGLTDGPTTGTGTPLPGRERGERIVLGVVTGAHGVRGEVKLRSFTEDPEAIAGYGPLERSDGGPPVRLSRLRPGKGGLIAAIEGIGDRTAAQVLQGVELWVPRARLPEPEMGQFYHVDLVGLAVERPDGSRIGEVVGVSNYGAGDLLEVRLSDGDRTAFLPFTDAVCRLVEPAAGRIVADPPEGLLEE